MKRMLSPFSFLSRRLSLLHDYPGSRNSHHETCQLVNVLIGKKISRFANERIYSWDIISKEIREAMFILDLQVNKKSRVILWLSFLIIRYQITGTQKDSKTQIFQTYSLIHVIVLDARYEQSQISFSQLATFVTLHFPDFHVVNSLCSIVSSWSHSSLPPTWSHSNLLISLRLAGTTKILRETSIFPLMRCLCEICAQ